MNPVSAPAARERRATARLAADCAAVARLLELRAPASERLEAELGPRLTRFLVGALRGRPTRHTGWLAA